MKVALLFVLTLAVAVNAQDQKPADPKAPAQPAPKVSLPPPKPPVTDALKTCQNTCSRSYYFCLSQNDSEICDPVVADLPLQLCASQSMKLIAAALALALVATPAFADKPAAEPEAFMREYMTLWNAGDAAAITSRFYRFDAPNPWQQQAGLQAEFDRLKAENYARSDLTGLEGCLLTRDRAVVELRYVRMKTDGTPMPPKDRLTLYFVRKFPDGWRVTQYMAASPTMNLNCKSAD